MRVMTTDVYTFNAFDEKERRDLNFPVITVALSKYLRGGSEWVVICLCINQLRSNSKDYILHQDVQDNAKPFISCSSIDKGPFPRSQHRQTD